MSDRPVAIGPASRTVVGDVPKTAAPSPPKAPIPVLPPKPKGDWKRLLFPVGIALGAFFILKKL